MNIFFVIKAENDLEINNVSLKNELVKYIEYLDSTTDTKEYVISVYYRQINDSTVKFVFSNDIFSDCYEFDPYHFIIRINNKDIFFISSDLINKYDHKKNFFKLKEKSYNAFKEKYFPKTDSLEKVSGESIIGSYHPLLWKLEFLDGKLVSKKISRAGLIWN